MKITKNEKEGIIKFISECLYFKKTFLDYNDYTIALIVDTGNYYNGYLLYKMTKDAIEKQLKSIKLVEDKCNTIFSLETLSDYTLGCTYAGVIKRDDNIYYMDGFTTDPNAFRMFDNKSKQKQDEYNLLNQMEKIDFVRQELLNSATLIKNIYSAL